MRRRPFGWPAVRCAFVLTLAFLGHAPLCAFAAPTGDDAYTAGYVAAVLERQLNINPRSLQVKDGVVSLDAADVPRADRPKIIAARGSASLTKALRELGVERVDILLLRRRGPVARPLMSPEQGSRGARARAASGSAP